MLTQPAIKENKQTKHTLAKVQLQTQTHNPSASIKGILHLPVVHTPTRPPAHRRYRSNKYLSAQLPRQRVKRVNKSA